MVKALQQLVRAGPALISASSLAVAAVLGSCGYAATGKAGESRLVRHSGDGAPVLLCTGGHFRGGALSADGRLIAVADEDGAIAVWDLHHARLLSRFPSGLERPVGHSSGHQLAFNRDGSLLALAGIDGRVHVWRTGSGERVAALVQAPRHNELTKPSGARVRWANASVSAVEFTPDGQSLVSGSMDGRVITWSTRDWSPRDSVWATEAWLRDMALADSGRTLAVVDYDGNVRLWQLERSLFLGTIRLPRGLTQLEVSLDDTLLAVTGDDKVIRVWSRRKGLQSDSVQLPATVTQRYRFSPDGRLLASEAAPGMIGVLDLVTRRWRYVRLPSRRGMMFLAFTADSRHLLTGQAYDSYVTVSPASGHASEEPPWQAIRVGESPCD